jgi:hypothetical protein
MEYAYMAQVLLKEVLPRFTAEELNEDFKEGSQSFKELLDITEMYSQKHYSRSDRNLKKVYYVDYVMSQMSLT